MWCLVVFIQNVQRMPKKNIGGQALVGEVSMDTSHQGLSDNAVSDSFYPSAFSVSMPEHVVKIRSAGTDPEGSISQLSRSTLILSPALGMGLWASSDAGIDNKGGLAAWPGFGLRGRLRHVAF